MEKSVLLTSTSEFVAEVSPHRRVRKTNKADQPKRLSRKASEDGMDYNQESIIVQRRGTRRKTSSNGVSDEVSDSSRITRPVNLNAPRSLRTPEEKAAALRGFDHACDCQRGENGAQQDSRKARNYFERSAEKGCGYAQCAVGVFYEYDEDAVLDYNEAGKWYGQAAEQGVALGAYNLACLLLRGIDMDQGFQKGFNSELLRNGRAVDLLVNAAGSGMPEAQWKLGVLLTDPDTSHELRELARKAVPDVTGSLLCRTPIASSGAPPFIEAAIKQAHCVALDCDETDKAGFLVGVAMLLLAVHQGYGQALVDLGHVLVSDRLTSSDIVSLKGLLSEAFPIDRQCATWRQKGVGLWQRAADLGLPRGLHSIFMWYARMFREGCGKENNIDGISSGEAKQCLEKSAAAGFAPALFDLGSLLLDGDDVGLGIVTNHEMALEFITEAAKSGNPDARLRLGDVLREQGDRQQAMKWYYLASTQYGGPEAHLRLAKLLLEQGNVDRHMARAHLKSAATQGCDEAIALLAQTEEMSELSLGDWGPSQSAWQLTQVVEEEAEALCRDHRPEVALAEEGRAMAKEERMMFDSSIVREVKRLPEWTTKLNDECQRKENQLKEMYDAARDRKFEKRRKKDRSVRTVEGYNDAWFRPEEDAKKKKHHMSVGERVSTQMGHLIEGLLADDEDFAELEFSPGIQVWRAVGFGMELDKSVFNGQLLKGASYVMAHISHDGAEELGGGLKIHLFHWVGTDASLDSKAVSSFKCTELAKKLRKDMAESLEDGRSSAKTLTMTRECEGEESPEFVQCFTHYLKKFASKDSMEYLEGGTYTALQRPPPKQDRPRLFRVCLMASHVSSTPRSATPKSAHSMEDGAGRLDGTPRNSREKRRVEASLCEVEACEGSLKPEWVLILDGGKETIFVYRGFLSTTLHRAKAFEMAFLMRQERIAFLGRCTVVQVDQGDEPTEFWKFIPEALGAVESQIAAAEPLAQDVEEPVVKEVTALHKRQRKMMEKKIAQWEQNISLAIDQVVDRVVDEMFTSSAQRILHSFYRQRQEVATPEEADVFDYEASFFAEDRSMGLTIKNVVIVMDRGEPRVQVVAVDAGSPGDLEGIEAGDILIAINHEPLGTLRRKAVSDRIIAAGRPVSITLRRGFPLMEEAAKSFNEKSIEKVAGDGGGGARTEEKSLSALEEEDERVRDFSSLMIENGHRPSVSVMNQFRSVLGVPFKSWVKKSKAAVANHKDEKTETRPEKEESRIQVEVDLSSDEVSDIGSVPSPSLFAKYQPVEAAVELRPGASVLVQRSTGDWSISQVVSYDCESVSLTVRVGELKKKVLELSKKKHLQQLRVRPGDVLLGDAPDSPASSRKRPPTPQKSVSRGGTPRGGTPKAGSSFNFQEVDSLEVDEFRQRRILYRVGMIGKEYNIAEVYKRSEEDSDHSEQVSRSALKTEGVFVLDCNTEVYVWVGRKVSVGVRLAGVQVAQRLVVMDKLRPKWVELSQVQEGAEPFVFRSKFLDWFTQDAQAVAKKMVETKHKSLVSTGQIHAITSEQAARQRESLRSQLESRTSEDILEDQVRRKQRILQTAELMKHALAQEQEEEEEEVKTGEGDLHDAMPVLEHLKNDDGAGMTIMWRLTPLALLQVDEVEHAHFRDNCIYVILYGFVVHADDEDEEELEHKRQLMEGEQEELDLLAEHDDPMVAMSAAVRKRGLRLEMGMASHQQGRPKFVLYVWCGERAPRTLLARWKMEVSAPWLEDWREELGQTPTEIRIQQRLEPLHFLRVFARTMVVHVDFGVQPTKGRRGKDEAYSPIVPKSLFHIRGRTHGGLASLHAVQMKLTNTMELCSSDVYLLHLLAPPTQIVKEPSNAAETQEESVSPVPKLWIWVGWSCPLDVKQISSQIAVRLSAYFVVDPSQVHVALETAPVFDSIDKEFKAAPKLSRSKDEIDFWCDMGMVPWSMVAEPEVVVMASPKRKKGLWRKLSPTRIKCAESSIAQKETVVKPEAMPVVRAVEPPNSPAFPMHRFPATLLRLIPNEDAFSAGGHAKRHLHGPQFAIDQRKEFTQHDLKRIWLVVVLCGESVYLWVGAEVSDGAGQVQDALSCARSLLDNDMAVTEDDEAGSDKSSKVLNPLATKDVRLVRQYSEPSCFQRIFHAWCPWEHFEKDIFLDPRAARLKRTGGGLTVGRVIDAPAPPLSSILDVVEEERRRSSEAIVVPRNVINGAGGDKSDQPNRLSGNKFIDLLRRRGVSRNRPEITSEVDHGVPVPNSELSVPLVEGRRSSAPAVLTKRVSRLQGEFSPPPVSRGRPVSPSVRAAALTARTLDPTMAKPTAPPASTTTPVASSKSSRTTSSAPKKGAAPASTAPVASSNSSRTTSPAPKKVAAPASTTTPVASSKSSRTTSPAPKKVAAAASTTAPVASSNSSRTTSSAPKKGAPPASTTPVASSKSSRTTSPAPKKMAAPASTTAPVASSKSPKTTAPKKVAAPASTTSPVASSKSPKTTAPKKMAAPASTTAPVASSKSPKTTAPKKVVAAKRPPSSCQIVLSSGPPTRVPYFKQGGEG